MQQYFLSPVITATDPLGETILTTNAAQSAVAAGLSYGQVIPTNPDGTAQFTWALVSVSGTSLSTILADVTNTALPALTLDAKLTTASAVVQSAARTALGAKGISTTWITAQSSLRDMINHVGQFLAGASWNVNNFGP